MRARRLRAGSLALGGFLLGLAALTAGVLLPGRASAATGGAVTITIPVTPPVDHLLLTAPAEFTAGVPFSLTVTAADRSNVTSPGFRDAVHFTSSDPRAVLPADYTFTTGTGLDNGSHTFSLSLQGIGNQSVLVTDTANLLIRGVVTIRVGPAPADHFGLAAPARTTAGVPFSLGVTAEDRFGNVAVYTRTVHFASSDPQVSLPADFAFTAADAGSHLFSVTLKTAGLQSVTATDTASRGIRGSAAVTVSAAPAASLSLTAPAAATAGAGFDLTVTARDAFSNTATGYTGTVHLTSSDPRATLPPDFTFLSANMGTKTFGAGVTLKTAGIQTLRATDTTAGITGGATISVAPAEAAGYILGAALTVSQGDGFTLIVTVADVFNNTATGYRGTATFASSDPRATLPANYTFTAADAGIHTFAGLTLRTAGSQTVTATDTVRTTVTGTANVAVSVVSLNVSGTTIFAIEGAPFSGGVATFTDPVATDPVSSYAAMVVWGDGTAPTPGTITLSGSTFTVSGAHTYAEEGAYSLTITVADLDGSTGAAASVALVADAPLIATGVPVGAVEEEEFTGPVASFRDLNPGAPLSDFTVGVDWGDGTPPTAGVVSGPGPDGMFTVTASHVYEEEGTFQITVRIRDIGGQTAAATSIATVAEEEDHEEPAGQISF